MRCRGFLGVLAGVWLLGACYATEPPADADTQTNWLRCGHSADCAGGDTCIDGHCVPSSAPRADAAASTAPSEVTDEIAGQVPGAARPEVQPRASERRDVVDAGASPAPSGVLPALFELGDVALLPGSGPAVGWQQNAAVVAWAETIGTNALSSVMVTLEGQVQRDSRRFDVNPTERFDILVAYGRIGVTRFGPGCRFETWYETSDTASPAIVIPCDDQLAAVAVQGSDDWVFAWSSGGRVSAARTSMHLGGWALPPADDLGELAPAAKISLFATGVDALLVWGTEGGHMLRNGAHFAGPVPENQTRPEEQGSWSEPIPVGPAGAGAAQVTGYQLADLGGRRLLFSAQDAALWVHVLERDGTSRQHTEIAAPIHGRVSVAAAPELGLAGVCFGTGPEQGNGVTFVLVDADGNRVGNALSLAAGEPLPAGCGVTWSGTTFLAVAWGLFQEVDWQMNTLTRMRGFSIDPAELL